MATNNIPSACDSTCSARLGAGDGTRDSASGRFGLAGTRRCSGVRGARRVRDAGFERARERVEDAGRGLKTLVVRLSFTCAGVG